MDDTLFHLINERWTSPILDLFMAAISNVDIWKPLLIVTVLAIFVFGRFKARACIVCMLLSLVVADQFTGPLKKAFDRRRPKQVEKARLVELQRTKPAFLTLFKEPTVRYAEERDKKNSGPSFPSGHMTNNTIIALCLTLFYRRWGWLYWILTLAIGYSRVYLAAHWPSDILATFFLAAGETLLFLAILELLWRWLAPRLMPKTYANHQSLVVDPGE
jgi:undecaprenyl-diphosphatase